MRTSRWWAAALLGVSLPAGAGGYDATVEWARKVALASPVSGVVAQVLVEPGDRVKQGQALVVLEAVPFQAAVARAQAELRRRKRERLEALRAWRRAKELYEAEVLATVELDQARLALTRAEAELQAAEAGLEEARYRLDRSRLAAPFDAVVLARRVEVGQAVAAELSPQVLVVVARAGRYRARFQVPLEALPALRPGRPARVEVGDREYAGVVREVALEPERTRDGPRYTVGVVFESAELLRAGTPAEVELR